MRERVIIETMSGWSVPAVATDEHAEALDGRMVVLVDGRLVRPDGTIAILAEDGVVENRDPIASVGTSCEPVARALAEAGYSVHML